MSSRSRVRAPHGTKSFRRGNKLVKRVWFTSLNDYLKQIAKFIREVRFVLYFLYCEGRFLQTHGPLLGRLDRVVFAGFLRLYIGWEMPRSGCYWMKDVIMYGGLNQSVGRSSGNGG